MTLPLRPLPQQGKHIEQPRLAASTATRLPSISALRCTHLAPPALPATPPATRIRSISRSRMQKRRRGTDPIPNRGRRHRRLPTAARRGTALIPHGAAARIAAGRASALPHSTAMRSSTSMLAPVDKPAQPLRHRHHLLVRLGEEQEQLVVPPCRERRRLRHAPRAAARRGAEQHSSQQARIVRANPPHGQNETVIRNWVASTRQPRGPSPNSLPRLP